MKLGFVERKPLENDRRSYFVILTDKGRETFEQHNRFHREFTREISIGLSTKEIQIFSQVMATLLKNM